MPWTETDRLKYKRKTDRYPSDVTDEEGPAGPKLRNRTNFRTYHGQRLYSERFSLKFRYKLRGGGYFDGEYWP